MTFRHILRLGALATLLASPALAEPLTVATEASFPPFSQTEPDGTFTGLEIDLGDAVCAAAGFECTWVKQDFDGAIAALNAGQFDMIFSSMSIRPEREEVADFSIPYTFPTTALFALEDSISEVPADLDGKTVGVYAGATQDSYAQANFPGAEVRGYETIDQITADLVAGRIDAMLVEQLAGLGFLATEEGAGYAQVGEVLDDPALGGGVGAMMRTGDERMARIDEAIRAVYADGTFDRISAEWLPEGADIHADGLWD